MGDCPLRRKHRRCRVGNMKVLLVSERQDLRGQLDHHFNPLGLEVIQYWNPIKAMDNIDEIDPDVVLFSARDFPRHWKPFLTFLRNHRTRDATVFVLLRPPDFAFEEASKAQHLGVNGLADDALADRQDINRLRDLIVRYKELREQRHNKRYVPQPEDRIEFIFSHPRTLQFVTGRIEDISASGLRFKAHRAQAVTEIESGELLRHCSLRLGDSILNLEAEVVRNDDALSLRFRDSSGNVQESIEWYLGQHSKRELGIGAAR
ncbi:MAG: PilZ domain-containing protein [Spirochaetaceae bacterium]|nr:MAG: PilZ domain-containing protein [Spirochaetaceae bacterium]